jgi:hypothetical protein
LNFYLFFKTSKASDPSVFYFNDGIAKSLAAKDRVREDLLLLSPTAAEAFRIVHRQEVKV